MKINLGCGTNKIPGWQNYDNEIDISCPLPFPSDAATCIFAEHVVEHITYEEALLFFMQCWRVLRTGGVLRIAVPSIERVWREATPEYMRFTRKWAQPHDDTEQGARRGAMTNILFRHGHRAPWTQGLLLASLFYSGFDEVAARTPGQSDHEELRGIEGHGRVIGEEFNSIETVVAEATK